MKSTKRLISGIVVVRAAVCLLGGVALGLSSTPRSLAAGAAASQDDFSHMLASKFAAAQSLGFTSKVTLYRPSFGGSLTVDHVLDTDVAANKPSYITITVKEKGKLIARIVDGPKGGSEYSPLNNTYATLPPAASLASAISDIGEGSQGVLPDYAAAACSSISEFVRPQPFTLPGRESITATTSKVNGAKVVAIDQSRSDGPASITLHVVHDAATGLPSRMSVLVAANGKKAITFSEEFSNFAVSHKAMVASTFDFTVPSDATKYVPQQEPAVLANGSVAPDFKVATNDGATVKLSDYAGKPVVLDFWATWCEPCQMSLPVTNKLSASDLGKQAVFLGICSWDQKPAFSSWMTRHKNWNMTFAYDPAGADEASSVAASLYKVSGIPTQFVIGKDGKIVGSTVGYDPAETDLKTQLAEAVAEPEPAAPSATAPAVSVAPPPPAAPAAPPAAPPAPAVAPPAASPGTPAAPMAAPSSAPLLPAATVPAPRMAPATLATAPAKKRAASPVSDDDAFTANISPEPTGPGAPIPIVHHSTEDGTDN